MKPFRNISPEQRHTNSVRIAASHDAKTEELEQMTVSREFRVVFLARVFVDVEDMPFEDQATITLMRTRTMVSKAAHEITILKRRSCVTE